MVTLQETATGPALIGTFVRFDLHDTDTGLYIVDLPHGQLFQLAHIASLDVWMIPGTWVECVED